MNDVKKDKFIEINYRGEYRLFIDDNIYDSSKFFYSVFQKSAELIREIHSCPEASDRDNCPYYLKDSEMPDTNNLIMYCADRGGGKSSAMLSFGNALKGIGSRSEEKKEGYEKFWEGMAGCRFAVLDAIDPTSLCEKEGIMTIILSRLFLEMRSDMQKNDREDQRDSGYRKVNEQSRYNIISKFRECYKYINVINGTSREFSDEEGDFSLEELAVLGDSSSFRKEFHNLVTLYLQNKYRTENISNDYLVIQIDDADLNTRKSYDILEDLRRYCMVPNVIILMAVNMPQMHQVVEQHFVREYDSLLRFSSGSSVFISCDAVKDKTVIEAKGHAWESDFTVDKTETCTESGSKSVHCADCGAVKDVTVIAPHDHSWDEGKVTKEPTTLENGEKVLTCTECGQTKTVSMPALVIPQTGDNSLALWFAVLFISGGVFVVFFVKKLDNRLHIWFNKSS